MITTAVIDFMGSNFKIIRCKINDKIFKMQSRYIFLKDSV